MTKFRAGRPRRASRHAPVIFGRAQRPPPEGPLHHRGEEHFRPGRVVEVVRGVDAEERFNHYSLLGTAEQLLRLSKLGQAASSPTMTKAFNL
jgi:hypothetical protein